jgi:hypothetical protein
VAEEVHVVVSVSVHQSGVISAELYYIFGQPGSFHFLFYYYPYLNTVEVFSAVK